MIVVNLAVGVLPSDHPLAGCVACGPKRGLTAALNHLEAPTPTPLVPMQRLSQLPAEYQLGTFPPWRPTK